MKVGGQRHAPTALLPGKKPGAHLYKAGWAPGPVWTGEENLASTGIRSPGRPAVLPCWRKLEFNRYDVRLQNNISFRISCILTFMLTQ
jgi:hypothetical protein